MADQLATGIQWVVDDSTGAVTGYRRKINGVDTAFALDAEAIQASVSGAWISSADLPTTTGSPGQVVVIGDGPDRGARLVWAIPEGATEYAWCWWLWPQSAY